jgi:uncharacterized protein (DUF4415 family)
MSENRKSSRPEWIDPDDAPDLSTPEWVEKFANAPVSRGRPKMLQPKQLHSIRLDPVIVDYFKGKNEKNWQTRLHDTLLKLARGEAVLTAKKKTTKRA